MSQTGEEREEYVFEEKRMKMKKKNLLIILVFYIYRIIFNDRQQIPIFLLIFYSGTSNSVDLSKETHIHTTPLPPQNPNLHPPPPLLPPPSYISLPPQNPLLPKNPIICPNASLAPKCAKTACPAPFTIKCSFLAALG